MEFIMATSKLKTQTTVRNKTSRKPTGWNVVEDRREDDTSNKWYLINHWPQGDEGKKRERVAASGQSRNPTTAESITGGVYCVHPSKHGRWMSAEVRRLSSEGSHPCWHQPPREPTIGITWVIRQSVWQWRVVWGGRSPGCWQCHNQLFRVTGDYNVIGDFRPISLIALFVKLLTRRSIKFL